MKTSFNWMIDASLIVYTVAVFFITTLLTKGV